MQYIWNKPIARSGEIYRDDSGILSLVIKCFGITNTSEQNFAIRISSVKTLTKCFGNFGFLNKFNIYIASLLMSSLLAIVICQKYFGNHVISSKIHLYARLLNMRRCTLWIYIKGHSTIKENQMLSTNHEVICKRECYCKFYFIMEQGFKASSHILNRFDRP